MGGIESGSPTQEELDEAYKINDQINRGEIKSADEIDGAEKVDGDIETTAENAPEFELTPEIEAKIMEKVQDIDKPGIAYSVVTSNSPDSLSLILKNGLLGNTEENREKNITPEKWAKYSRNRLDAVVHFNVVGKSRILSGKDPYEREIKQSYYANPPGNFVTVMFDTEKYRELEPIGLGQEQTVERKNQTYRAYWREQQPIHGAYPTDEYGYQLSSRVKPSNVTGLIFRLTRKINDREINQAVIRNQYGHRNAEAMKDYDVDEDDDRILANKAKEIARVMLTVNKNHPEHLVPIYDIDGNLWWPKQLIYGNVKGFVAERDSKGIKFVMESF